MNKKCTKCLEVKFFNDFNNSKNCKDGKNQKCKDCIKIYNKQFRKNKRFEYETNNKDQIKIFKEEQKEKRKKYLKDYAKEKIRTDPLIRLKYNIRSKIYGSLKKQGYNKNSKTFNIIQCDYNFLMDWLNGIGSNNYSYGIKNVHLDHVVPISLAKTEKEMILLCHYSNYQLLSSFDNLSKNNRTVNPINLARVLQHHPNPDKIREIHSRL